MQTVSFRMINGYKIIIGYGNISIDPIRTQKAIKNLMAKDKDVKRIEDLNRQIKTLNKQINGIQKKPFMETQQEGIQLIDYLKQREDCINEMFNLEKLNKIKIQKLTIEKAVYFEPTKNEVIKTAKEIETLKAIKLSKNELLDIDGKRIPNWTGVSWWIKKDKWEVIECQLGEVPPNGAKIYSDLTDNEKDEIEKQNDKDRIDLLGIDGKKEELQRAIDSIAIQAANKKVSLEIQGIKSDKALKDAQKWYKEQVELLNKKYK